MRSLSFVLLPLLAFAADPPPLETVPSVDLKKYAGKWYEIARLPNRFQKDCTGNVTATYTLRGDTRITVVNECREGDEIERAEGVARVPAGSPGNAVLEVRFAPAFLSWLPVWGDYRIIALDAEYRHAMVGTRDRKYLWILARSPKLEEGVVRRLLDLAKRQGFATDRVRRTPHQ
ncbi:MAG: lipocalin family protein [Bryobacteraceae bacterium]|nr:lipocalin family protein [Bryobacteraceae bacterium]